MTLNVLVSFAQRDPSNQGAKCTPKHMSRSSFRADEAADETA